MRISVRVVVPFSGITAADSVTRTFGCTSAETESIVGSENFDPVISRAYPVRVGTYLVDVLFAEVFAGACTIGSRTMDLTLEGVRVLDGAGTGDGFDPHAASLAENAGGDPLVPNACGGLVVRSFEVTVNDGALDLVLSEDASGAGDPNAQSRPFKRTS